jgi:NTP pyrophosphatase (non-canonical NTP hydrolase)
VAKLTFELFRRINSARCARWHEGFPNTDSWSISDWSNALQGEVGELSDALLALVASISASSGQLANLIKKIRRLETGALSKRPDEQDIKKLVSLAGKEAGDVLAYLDLLMTKLGLELGVVAAEKFNEISERENWPERMPLDSDTEPYVAMWCAAPPSGNAAILCSVLGHRVGMNHPGVSATGNIGEGGDLVTDPLG